MASWSTAVDDQAKKHLAQREREIDDLESALILRAARKDFNLPPINLYILDKNRRSYYAQASKKRVNGETVRSIRQTPHGMTVHTILHEIAHHFPGGFDHGAGWCWAYFTLVTWFNHQDSQNRFQTTVPEFDLLD